MANVLAQNPAAVSFSGAATVSVTFASACTPGSLIVASVTQEGAGTFTDVADGTNGTYGTADISVVTGGVGNGEGRASVYSKQNTASTAVTVTATLSGNSSGFLKCYELTGQATSAQVDTTGSGSGTNTQHTLSLTPGTSNCSVIAIGTHYPSGGVADASYTGAFTETGLNTSYHFGEYRVDAGAAGLITLTEGLGSEQGWSFVAAAYKTAATSASSDGKPLGPYHADGPGQGPRMRRMSPQKFPVPDPPLVVPASRPSLPNRGKGMGPRLRRMSPQRFADAGAGTTLIPSEGSISIAGVAASITLTIAAIAGAVTIAGNAPSISTILQGAEGSVVVSGNAASSTLALAPVAGSVVLSGSAPSLSGTLAGVTGAVTIGGNTPSVTNILPATDGVVVVGGNAPSLVVSSGLSPTEGAIEISGNAPNLLTSLVVSEGIISVTGYGPDIPITLTDGSSNFSLSRWQKWHRPEDERELRKLRLTPAVAEVIAQVAERQAQALDLDEQQRLEELTRELELKRLKFQGRYLEVLNIQRQQLIDEEIGRLMGEKQAAAQRLEEEAILLFLMTIA